MINPILAKDFVMELQVYVVKILKDKLPHTYTTDELLDITNEIVEYSFGLMLRTHTDKQLRFKFMDDDIPF